MKRTVLFILLFLLAHAACLAQAKDFRSTKDFRIAFEEIQHGFETENVAAIASWFGPHVQVNLKGEESGYYSANHAYYILQNYFKTHKVLSFEFTAIGENDVTPFASGTVMLSHRGTREIAQVYVSLTMLDRKWAIAEITIH